MTNIVRAALALGSAAALSACARPEPEPVYIEPAPIVTEPVYSKYQ